MREILRFLPSVAINKHQDECAGFGGDDLRSSSSCDYATSRSELKFHRGAYRLIIAQFISVAVLILQSVYKRTNIYM